MSNAYQQGPPQLRSRVINAKFFDSLGYSTVWEDERVIDLGLRPETGDRVLSVTSGGCFSLQFLLHDVEEVISVDFNRKQSDLLCLKATAAASLSHDELWGFLGLSPCKNRRELYGLIRERLPQPVRDRFDANSSWIEEGVTLTGKQDRYLHWVGGLVERLQGKGRVEALLSSDDIVEHQSFYKREWDRKRWKVLCGLIFNRFVLHKAFDKEHFVHSQEKNPAQRLRQEIERSLLNTPGSDNFYLYYLFRKSYPSKEDCPAWLRASNFESLRDRVGRLRIETEELEKLFSSLPMNHIDCFNLSNAFDWVSTGNFVRLMEEVIRVARDGARLCYWTNVINTRRELSWVRRSEIIEDEDLSRKLSQSSRTAGYSGCVVATVNKDGRSKRK